MNDDTKELIILFQQLVEDKVSADNNDCGSSIEPSDKLVVVFRQLIFDCIDAQCEECKKTCTPK